MAIYSGPFSDLPLFRYGLIMADPPWHFEVRSQAGIAKSPQAHYACASLADIKALPVGNLAGRDCILWLWATNPMLPQALEVMAAWGFTFTTAGHWVKYNEQSGKLAFGTGYVLRCAGEPFLIGTMGSPRLAKDVRSVIMAPRRQHSRKPEEAFANAERLVPNAFRLELFSRQPRDGWDTWGDQAEHFAGAA